MSPSDDNRTDSLDSRTLKAIRNINIIPDMVAGARYTGIHSSKDRGGDVEFAEHRQYEPGDDLRHLDWNALAKTDELFLKQYESETQITGQLFLDGSESMNFGSHDITKWNIARAVAVLVASTLINQQDRVTITLSRPTQWNTGNISDFTELKKQISALDEKNPGGDTTILDDLKRHQSDERALWIIVSDFWLNDVDEFFQWLRGFKERGHDAVLIPVWDPLERSFDVDEAVELKDMETNETLHMGPSKREEFREALQEYREKLNTLARSAGLSFWPFYTDRSIFELYRSHVTQSHN